MVPAGYYPVENVSFRNGNSQEHMFAITQPRFIRIVIAGSLFLALAAVPAGAKHKSKSQDDNVLTPEAMPTPVMAPSAGQPLQGGIQETGTAAAPLQGGVEQTGTTPTNLQGGAQGGDWNGTAQQGQMGQQQFQMNANQFQGGVGQNGFNLGAGNDPDMNDQELLIQWDAWRNRLMHAIEQGTLDRINVQNNVNFVWDQRANMMVSRFPNGIACWYSIDVLPNRRIVNLRLTKPSGFQGFDQAVWQSIFQLEGNKILQYPKGSQRQTVTQEGAVETAKTTQFQNFHFGDVEHERERR